MSDIKINGPVSVQFTPQGISYVLDMLANCPWKIANPLISDIMTQLKSQEGELNGPTGSGKASTGRGNPSHRGGGVSPLEIVQSDNGAEDLRGHLSEYDAAPRSGAEG